jgi:hypothetical protein
LIYLVLILLFYNFLFLACFSLLYVTNNFLYSILYQIFNKNYIVTPFSDQNDQSWIVFLFQSIRSSSILTEKKNWDDQMMKFSSKWDVFDINLKMKCPKKMTPKGRYEKFKFIVFFDHLKVDFSWLDGNLNWSCFRFTVKEDNQLNILCLTFWHKNLKFVTKAHWNPLICSELFEKLTLWADLLKFLRLLILKSSKNSQFFYQAKSNDRGNV